MFSLRNGIRSFSIKSNQVVANSVNSLIPMDFNKASKVEGSESQIVHIRLKPNQSIRAETGAMLYMTDGINVETTSGGFMAGMKRKLTGENFFVSNFSYSGDAEGQVAFGTNFPSKILRFSLAEHGGSMICKKGAFLCGSSTIEIEMEFAKKFSAGFFGGEGFVLQRLVGEGDAFVKVSGALIERDLAPGEQLRVSTGCLVAFEPSVEYDITTMSGFKNVVFGGEGLFVTTLTGPGKVFLEGLPFERVVDQIARRIPSSGMGGLPIGMGMGGSGESQDKTDGEGGQTENSASEDSSMNAASSPFAQDEDSFSNKSSAFVEDEPSSDSSSTFKEDPSTYDFPSEGEQESKGMLSSIYDMFFDKDDD